MKINNIILSEVAPLKTSLWIKPDSKGAYRFKLYGLAGWTDIINFDNYTQKDEIKTINGQSLLGKGNITIQEPINYYSSYNITKTEDSFIAQGYYISEKGTFILGNMPELYNIYLIDKIYDDNLKTYKFSFIMISGDASTINPAKLYYTGNNRKAEVLMVEGGYLYFLNPENSYDKGMIIKVYSTLNTGNDGFIIDDIKFEEVNLNITNIDTENRTITVSNSSNIKKYDVLDFSSIGETYIVYNIEGNVITLSNVAKLTAPSTIKALKLESYCYDSFLLGYSLKAFSPYQLVSGKFNLPSETKNYLQVIGCGRNDSNRSNALTVTDRGVEWLSSDVTCGGTEDTPTHKLSEKLNNPTGGTEGQVLTKTSSGVAWTTPSSGGANVSVSGTTLIIS